MAKNFPQINPKSIILVTLVWMSALFGLADDAPADLASRENDVVRAVRQAGPAVVNISSQYEIRKKSNPFSGYGMDPRLEDLFNDFFSPELRRRQKRSSLGSGVIIDGQRGFVLTNTHVIDKATTITVTLKDNREFAASIVGMDPDSDLAVLKIETKQGLPAIQMGDSQDLMIGESVIAIGNPFGFSHTVTTGVVSAVKRSVKTSRRVFHEFIQTDASINPGNSGGPLLNIHGELIGINTAIFAQAQGIGFAIPINRARRIVRDLIHYGAVVRAWIGMRVHPVDARLAEYLHLESDQFLIVSGLEPESPASSSGVKEGDILVTIDGEKVTTVDQYHARIKEIRSGQKLNLVVRRQSTQLSIQIQSAVFPLSRTLEVAQKRLGILVAVIDSTLRTRYGIQTNLGVVIVKVRKNAHLYRIGLRPGDIVRQMDESRIDTLEDFKKAMARHRKRKSVVLLIQREDQLYYINAIMKDEKW